MAAETAVEAIPMGPPYDRPQSAGDCSSHDPDATLERWDRRLEVVVRDGTGLETSMSLGGQERREQNEWVALQGCERMEGS